MRCRLCTTQELEPYHQIRRRRYFECKTCGLVSVASSDLPTLAMEHAEYALHRNSVNDPGYRRFLSRAFNPVVERIGPPATGLDFGCGPGPALAAMLREHGFSMAVYDPCFAKEASVLTNNAYDFVTCTEVVEHVHQARTVWRQQFGMLKGSGFLVVMTKRVGSPLHG